MSGNKIVSASSDASLRLWTIEMESVPDKEKKLNVRLKEEPQILKGHTSDIYCVELNEEFICSGMSAQWSNRSWNCGKCCVF